MITRTPDRKRKARRGAVCPHCEGTGFLLGDDGPVKPCPHCEKGQRIAKALKTSPPAPPPGPVCETCGDAGVLLKYPLGHPRYGEVVSCPDCEAGRERDRMLLEKRLAFAEIPPELARWRLSDVEVRHPDVARAAEFMLEHGHIPMRSGKLYYGMYLHGEVGTGKTVIAAALTNEMVLNGQYALFISVPDMLLFLKAAFGRERGEYERRFETIRSAPVLVLDDLGTERPTDFTVETLWMIVDYRITRRLPVIVTSNLTPEALIEQRPDYTRILSRLMGMTLSFELVGDDWRMPGKGN